MSASGFDYRAVPRLVRPHLGGSRRLLAAAVSLAVVSAFAELAVPYAVYRLLVHVVVGHGGMAVPQAVALAAAGVVVTYLTFGAATALAHRAAFEVIARIRIALGEAWSVAELSDLSDRHTASARSAAGEEVERLEGILAHGVPEFAASVTVWLAMTVWLLGEDWRLALACAAVAPLAFWTMRRAMRSNAHRMGEFVEANAAMGRAMMDQLTALAEIRVFGARTSGSTAVSAIQRTARLQSAWGAAFLRWGAWFSPLVTATPAVVAVLGAWLLAAGRLKVDTFLLFVVLAPAYTVPLVTLFYRMHSLPLAAASARAVEEQLDLAPREPTTVTGREPRDRTLVVDGLDFGHRGRESTLRRVSFRVPEGTTVALVGESGSGKTTLLEVIAGVKRPPVGEIMLGGVPTADLLGVPGRRWVSLAAQNPLLFAGSIGENLRMGAPDAPDGLLLDALNVVGLLWELGDPVLDRRLGEAGSGLSGGQRQRLALARALVVNAWLVLMDEPTASVDPLTEDDLWESISRWCRGRTLVMATHRIALARRADHIVVLDRGAIAEQGTHDELLDRGGLYAELTEAESRAGAGIR
ncbi:MULTISPECIES: ABC transporter ATP-binding protein [unclassified Dietzia]|uniref:ABC transporter ATP-binding protein n=1 Tax=unclassified Dietzia TaxID=2617939 RepID=UPI0015FE6AAB|nr:ABC transporter ATP-binding protein [Dietzia sp. DQ12-76]MBB1025507.1 ABC transporter ATP-binding protein [Dietzia sp. DQ12-76]MBB1027296.1 ABC transporter ATP-binding protein [Dietzia sp. DQ11-38-2]